MIALAVVIALIAIPPRCGDYGIVAFFTIAWAAQSLFYLAQLRAAAPPPQRSAFILLAVMTALFSYPIVAGWISRSFDTGGLVAFLGAVVVQWVFLIVNRRIVFPSIFGAEKRPFLTEFRAVRAAQREAGIESSTRIQNIRSQFEDPERRP